MKNTTKRRLLLSKTTLRNIGSDKLVRVAGAQTFGTCTALPDLCEGLDTQFVHGCNSGLH